MAGGCLRASICDYLPRWWKVRDLEHSLLLNIEAFSNNHLPVLWLSTKQIASYFDLFSFLVDSQIRSYLYMVELSNKSISLPNLSFQFMYSRMTIEYVLAKTWGIKWARLTVTQGQKPVVILFTAHLLSVFFHHWMSVHSLSQLYFSAYDCGLLFHNI